MSSVLPLLREERKSDFGDVRAAVDPQRSSLTECKGRHRKSSA
jgi:hypothetical protein